MAGPCWKEPRRYLKLCVTIQPEEKPRTEHRDGSRGWPGGRGDGMEVEVESARTEKSGVGCQPAVLFLKVCDGRGPCPPGRPALPNVRLRFPIIHEVSSGGSWTWHQIT